MLTPGRPRFGELLREFVSSTASKGGTHGAFVGVCGPVSMTRDVAHVVRTLDAETKKAVGGIHIHEECVLSFSNDRYQIHERFLESLDGSLTGA